MRQIRSNRLLRAVMCLAIAVLFLLFCSCVSFNIGDWPSRYVYPHNKPAANVCGWTGAFCAYYLLYFIGPGVYVLLASGIWFFAARLIEHGLGQTWLRLAGVLLLTGAASSSFYCVWPHRFYDFPIGSGGLVGVAATEFLRGHFATLGTVILMSCTWLVGVVLVADSVVIAAVRWAGAVLLKTLGAVWPLWSATKRRSAVLAGIWRKLSVRERQFATAGNRGIKQGLLISRGGQAGLRSRAEHQDKAGCYGGKTKQAAGVRAASTKAPQTVQAYVPPSYKDYTLPGVELLAEPEYSYSAVQDKVIKAKAVILENLLAEFNVNARVVTVETGPVITMFELELAAGVKVSQIRSLANDIARALGAGAVRVVAPMPGKHTIGIEVPNNAKERVRIKDLMRLAGDSAARMQIPLFLGKDSGGQALVSDLTGMPHLLIAGTTGSGKSVCINSIITGILLTKRPDEVKLILIDPKMVEMTMFNTVPHLMCPIVTETMRAAQILEWATVKMDERYSLLAEARVKNVVEYNGLGEKEIIERFKPGSADEEAKIPKRLPYIVIVIDELADLMMTAAKEIEAFIVRLAQKSRAVGIHIVLATQRPQATVVTGLIKSNMPTRIGFRVAARMDSRIILDQNGAETLLGQGDMLFLKPGTSDLVRAQGTFVDETEIKRIVKHLKEVAEPQFHPELVQLRTLDVSEMEHDELFDDAARIIIETQRGSVSLLQRRLNIGYARASRIIEMLAAAGVLGEYKGSQAREVLMTAEEYERIRERMQAQAGEESGDVEPAGTQKSSQQASYISEGQRGYVSVDNDS
ncbi:MAG TPA: DNA translocase FtsK 4TM domain-containing protein [Sedimentisphaerales bacterium]|nr:DNA translocase FtsK 4TM domain-containing protein [Sedimentisphaerales bacterium]